LGDIPVPADYDGDSKADLAVVRPTSGQWLIFTTAGQTVTANWGTGAYLVPGDYDFDHDDDIAVWLPNGSWAIKP
jgi:hypothetical protein